MKIDLKIVSEDNISSNFFERFKSFKSDLESSMYQSIELYLINKIDLVSLVKVISESKSILVPHLKNK